MSPATHAGAMRADVTGRPRRRSGTLRCPRCGALAVVALGSLCVTCGHDMQSELPRRVTRRCLSCGRWRPSRGMICSYCEEAIALGAKAPRENVRAVIREGRNDRIGYCPAAEALKEMRAEWNAKERERLERLERKRAHDREYARTHRRKDTRWQKLKSPYREVGIKGGAI